ncbi:hypothetical protein GQF61_11790 [Sphingobacterium sp. DK4209]|uniref:Uncharacterized protein n=1 Tax=Sphingobacterium zhuxiongii TaxID=2662364 RepID=A0A5Q0QE43_9SPHI|nr:MULTISPECIES: hypothetical protein [unclassified Sphingobacterium]MVZ66543.1 hypothetical protein [Sphingobacterium sp. DK4209]QGA27803.1 hypothetical protein GFH32_16400 [Sphingobacterium sp. dk4302]
MDLQDLLNKQEGDNQSPKAKSPLVSLKADLDFYKEAIQEVAVELMAEGYTLYPIFVAHQHEVDLGEVILDRAELNTAWTVHASSLEEFIEKGLIEEDKRAYFEKSFKPANEFMCLFVVVPEGANFVFYPY